MIQRINVIDLDINRRARVARELYSYGIHVEIYEDISEFEAMGGSGGLLFICDDPELALSENIERIREIANEPTRIIGYSENPTPERIVACMRAGTADFLEWPFDTRLLDRVVRRARDDDDSWLYQELVRTRAKARVRQLSPRETDVLAHLILGGSNKEIGLALGISSRTVEIHRANMLSKLGANSASEAVRIGVHAGLDEGVRLEVLEVAD